MVKTDSSGEAKGEGARYTLLPVPGGVEEPSPAEQER